MLFIRNYIKKLGALMKGGRCTIRSYTIKACRDGTASLLLMAGAESLRCSVLAIPKATLSPVPCASFHSSSAALKSCENF